MTDDKTRQLENRIETLESTIEKMMPSRRDALKMGGAALVGGAAMSGTASAGTNQVGTIGSQASPVDLESEDINNADTITTQDLVVNGTATGPFGGGFDISSGYVDETSNRSIGTIFTNNKGPIFASVSLSSDDPFVFTVEVDSVQIAFFEDESGGRPGHTFSFLVPSGSTYEVKDFNSSNPALNSWNELELT